MVDLSRWLDGVYRVPSDPDPDEPDGPPTEEPDS